MFLMPVKVGVPEHPRYLIADSDGNYWAGHHWTKDESGGMLYLNLIEVCNAMRGIYLTKWAGRPYNKLQAICDVEVFGTPPDISSLTDWLTHHSQILIDYQSSGTGPDQDQLVLPSISWGTLTN